ncbi:MAG: hypothetical protein E6I61_05195 [Chloroflexi bacterium]|nr:MAG: hypothetical protein E6I61_05195 [Chloroflexota bacterium]TME49949.1 MAG: hypothetical protein E6I53_14350 [Chloroflexota bacterium]
MRRTAAFLSAGLLGVVALLSGLSLDAYLHARDPSLAHREGIFTLGNPGHVLLGIGIGLVVVGVVGAAYTSLPYGVWIRRGLLASALALLVVSGDIAGWAASVERSGLTSSTTATHNHTSSTLERQPTATELAAAAKLVTDTKASVARYASLNAAMAAGYKAMEPEADQVVHYVNPAYLTDADILNPLHVQSLIYFNAKQGPVLIGAMYIMPRSFESGPQVGGPLTVWHQHSNICFDDVTGMAVAFVNDPSSNANEKSGSCPRGSTHKTTPQMLHVWLIDNPDGPFASTMAPDVLGTAAAVT